MLYDAVAVVAVGRRRGLLASNASALDFVRDAHAHCKFVGLRRHAMALFEAAGLTDQFDDGYMAVTAKRASANAFIETCGLLRHWQREPATRWALPIGE